MIHSRIDPVVDPQLPREQAGFRRSRSTVDQVTLLTQDIEDSFQNNEKAGVVLLDLTAAYDTVWHRGLHLKLLRIIPDRHMVCFIMEMLSNRSFVVHTSDGQRSWLRRMMSRRVTSSHRCCLTSISAIFRKQLQGSTVMLTTWPSYCDTHLGRKWKRVSTKTWLSW